MWGPFLCAHACLRLEGVQHSIAGGMGAHAARCGSVTELSDARIMRMRMRKAGTLPHRMSTSLPSESMALMSSGSAGSPLYSH